MEKEEGAIRRAKERGIGLRGTKRMRDKGKDEEKENEGRSIEGRRDEIGRMGRRKRRRQTMEEQAARR